MNRKAIRNLARFFINELTELPEGLFKDEDASVVDLNEIINLSQIKVHLDLINLIPEEFRKIFLFSTTANKGDYNLSSDLSVTDYLRIEDIFHNVAGKSPKGLLYVDPDQVFEFDKSLGTPGEPKVWYWKEAGVIGLRPIPLQGVANKYLVNYFAEIPDLNQDETHDPSTTKYAIPPFPKCTHKLIAIDVVAQLQIADEDGALEILKYYNLEFEKIMPALKIKPSLKLDKRLSLAESVR